MSLNQSSEGSRWSPVILVVVDVFPGAVGRGAVAPRLVAGDLETAEPAVLGGVGLGDVDQMAEKGVELGLGGEKAEAADLEGGLLAGVEVTGGTHGSLQRDEAGVVRGEGEDVGAELVDGVGGDEVPAVAEVVVVPGAAPGGEAGEILREDGCEGWKERGDHG